MIPGQAVHAPMGAMGHAPAPSPLAAMLQHRAMQSAPPMHGHPGGPPMQAPGAPMPLSAGGHAAPKFGHAPAVMPGC